MNIPKIFAPLLLAAVFLGAAPGAQAGRSCEARKTTPQTVERGMTLAEKTLASLNARASTVFAIRTWAWPGSCPTARAA
jgi:hypothetical protein